MTESSQTPSPQRISLTQEFLLVAYGALGIAGCGAFLRLVFFKSWGSVVTVFLVLFLVWWVLFFILLWVIRISVPHLYVWIVEGGDLLTESSGEQEGSSGFSKTTMSNADEIFAEDIFETGEDAQNTDTTKKPAASVVEKEDEKAAEFDLDEFPQRVVPPKKRVSTQLSDEEIERIRQFEPKDIAKAVSFMMGPDEDNPLLKNKQNPISTKK